MNAEISIKSFIISIDIVRNCVDLPNFIEFIKSNYKREVIIINAHDLLESGARGSKNEAKTEKKVRYDVNNLLIKGIKQKMDSEIAKSLDSKKKALIANEKAKIQTTTIKTSKSKMKSTEDRFPMLFDGLFDVLVIIIGFPYLPIQFKVLQKYGVEISAFLCFRESSLDNEKYNGMNASKSSQVSTKKNSIPGFDFDYSNNVYSYPPMRWKVLKPYLDPSVAFINVEPSQDYLIFFQHIEKIIVKIAKNQLLFSEFMAIHKLIEIPTLKKNASLHNFYEYLIDHPDDNVNALYIQLKNNGFRIIPPIPTKTSRELLDATFQKYYGQICRNVVLYQAIDSVDPVFINSIPSSLYYLLYDLKKFDVAKTELPAMISSTRFINDPQNFYIYSGQVFDNLVSNVAKSKQLSMPSFYFDWQNWNCSIYHQSIFDELNEAVSLSSIVEKYLDSKTGLLYILTLAPVTKNNGFLITDYFMPGTIDGISEMIELKESSIETSRKSNSQKSQSLSIFSSSKDILPSSQLLFSNTNKVYRLPHDVSKTVSAKSSYSFVQRIRIDVSKEIINNQENRLHSLFIKDYMAVYTEPEQVVIVFPEGLRLVYENQKSFSLLFLEQSIFYNGSDLILKSSNKLPIVITKDASFICQNEKGNCVIVYPNGSISRKENDIWICVDSSGTSFKKEGNVLVPTESRHAKITNISTKTDSIIRPDNIEYFVTHNGMRKILFKLDYSIEQHEDKTLFDIPDFPIIEANTNGKTMSINRFTIIYTDHETVISCNDFRISISDSITIENFDSQIYIFNNNIECKCGNKYFISNEGHIGMMNKTDEFSKKKVDTISTRFGELYPNKENISENQMIELCKTFRPRFFAVRSDYGGTEFMRKDSIAADGYTTYDSTLLHTSGCECSLVTYHNPNPEIVPFAVVLNHPASKLERNNITKQFNGNSNKMKRINQIESISQLAIEADSLRSSVFGDMSVFTRAIAEIVERNHDSFLDTINPPEIIQTIVPATIPVTPKPRLLEMQQGLYTPKICNPKSVNYWKSPESTFSYVEPPKVSSFISTCPISKMFDPPLEVVFDNPPEILDTNHKPKPRRILSDFSLRHSASYKNRNIDIGIIKKGTKMIKSIEYVNSTTHPIHYSFTQPSSHDVRITTLPGIVFPNSSLIFQLEILTSETRSIESSFIFQSKDEKIVYHVAGAVVE